MKVRSIKKNNIDELRPEYYRSDFGKGIRGKYYGEYKAVNNLVLISPDVVEIFPNEKAVNNALIGLINFARKTVF